MGSEQGKRKKAELLAEYAFSKGTRGKYAKRYAIEITGMEILE